MQMGKKSGLKLLEELLKIMAVLYNKHLMVDTSF